LKAPDFFSKEGAAAKKAHMTDHTIGDIVGKSQTYQRAGHESWTVQQV
jgi:hypothetical protein